MSVSVVKIGSFEVDDAIHSAAEQAESDGLLTIPCKSDPGFVHATGWLGRTHQHSRHPER
ncbi:Protein of uncharacterised function (DUF1480) [Serratia rubidaea]|uniref:Protein of uncharacterized function (DUF1480) n=1 Tax=Serratia rubidaea TaxID=61652 RepID=A0A4U9HIE8_SERRU|nr:Protein of uncharacterised function (DUF1480) [Serratia rubidaea]